MGRYDFKEYTKIEDIIDYDGFLTPNGTFYRVRHIKEDVKDKNHKDWSLEFLKHNNDFKLSKKELKIYNTYNDLLWYAGQKIMLEYHFKPYITGLYLLEGYKDNVVMLSPDNFNTYEQYLLYKKIIEEELRKVEEICLKTK
jgi:hypothetical protein